MSDFKGLKIGYAFCGSFCTFRRSIEELKKLQQDMEEKYISMPEAQEKEN